MVHLENYPELKKVFGFLLTGGNFFQSFENQVSGALNNEDGREAEDEASLSVVYAAAAIYCSRPEGIYSFHRRHLHSSWHIFLYFLLQFIVAHI